MLISTKIWTAELNKLVTSMKVDVITLSEVLIPRGVRVEMRRVDAPGIHYGLVGTGTLTIAGGPSIPLSPHTLVIVPPRSRVSIDVDGGVRDRTPQVAHICGFFDATYGNRLDVFSELSEPIVDRFRPGDQIDTALKEAITELGAQRIGVRAMTAALLKQVMISLVRRSLATADHWIKRFSVLRDRQIARAFAEMSAKPAAAHTIRSLIQTAGLSRSTFMSRFVAMFGKPPMVALRDLRMRQAALQLTTTNMTIDEIARYARYSTRSSFVRAFRSAHRIDPGAFRAARSARFKSSS